MRGRPRKEGLGQTVEDLEPLPEGKMFLFYLQTGNGEPLQMTELERDKVRMDWRETRIRESGQRAVVQLGYDKWLVKEWQE